MRQKSSSLFQKFRQLDVSLKLVFFGAFVGTLFLFLPFWLQVSGWEHDISKPTPLSHNAFEDFPIFGVFSLLFFISSFFLFFHSSLGNEKILGLKDSTAIMLVGLQSLFLMTIAFFTFIALSPHFDAGSTILFGFYVVFFSHIVVTFGGYLLQHAERKKAEEVHIRKYTTPSPIAFENLSIQPEVPKINDENFSLTTTEDERNESVLRR